MLRAKIGTSRKREGVKGAGGEEEGGGAVIGDRVAETITRRKRYRHKKGDRTTNNKVRRDRERNTQ